VRQGTQHTTSRELRDRHTEVDVGTCGKQQEEQYMPRHWENLERHT